MATSHVVELVVFKLKDGADVDAFQQAADSVNSFLDSAPGFIKRELLRDDERWVDIVHWESVAQAQAAAESIMGNEAGQHFGSFIDDSDMLFTHLHPVLQRATP